MKNWAPLKKSPLFDQLVAMQSRGGSSRPTAHGAYSHSPGHNESHNHGHGHGLRNKLTSENAVLVTDEGEALTDTSETGSMHSSGIIDNSTDRQSSQ
jgi:hypothetical protein